MRYFYYRKKEDGLQSSDLSDIRYLAGSPAYWIATAGYPPCWPVHGTYIRWQLRLDTLGAIYINVP